jgi:hypothetical protein
MVKGSVIITITPISKKKPVKNVLITSIKPKETSLKCQIKNTILSRKENDKNHKISANSKL